ncbi:HAD family hydrolase [Vibrio sp. 10N.286.49.B3]|uniref:HAD family hydrolase n=1 Tax=Vibrio sp. 10N.286.49.B3 TaxID=1880855 RepID=UPI000C850B39|nr:HAD family hydrolase [Vibrio sp. 10N.286.49.B3]PMH45928.1 HAD family hydrolase [Vibrio sp. 10N.286.49.B3]
MLKAIFFDMDETLCDTSYSNRKASEALTESIERHYPMMDSNLFVQRYTDGFYKRLHADYPELLTLLNDELEYRTHLIILIAREQDVLISKEEALALQVTFDQSRMDHFDFFAGVEDKLVALREKYTLVVITNGPGFSQHPKLKAVAMSQYADHIIVGGDEPEEKPAQSIFTKALNLAKVQASEVIHIGDSYECDIIGAANSDIASVWVSYQAETTSSLANYTIDHPDEMFAVIEQHSQSIN